jgi:hypothetical protein
VTPQHRTCRSRLLSSTAGIEPLERRTYLTVAFAGPTNHPGVAGPVAAVAADFSGDTAGVAVAGYAPSATTIPVVGVYLASSGTFGTPTISAFSGTAAALATGDFLDNGEPDIAVLDSSTNQVDTFLNYAGNLEPGDPVSLPGTSGDSALAAADFNGDGQTDLAVVDPVENQVVVELSAGVGGFAQVATVPVPSPIAVAAVDLNDDGLSDLAVLSSDGSVYVAINQHGGVFGPLVEYGTGIADPKAIVAVDLNGDALPDLAVVGSATAGGPGTVDVLLNQEGGTFPAGAVAVASVPANPTSIVSGNFTGSGHTDLAVPDGEGGLSVIPGNGDGTFGAVQSVYTTQLAPAGPAVAADLNGDGFTDILYPDASGGFSELLNTTGGTTSPTPTPTTSPLAPTLSGTLPATNLVAGQTIKPIRQTVTLSNTGTAKVSGKTTVAITLSTTAAGGTDDPVVATAVIPRLSLNGKKTTRVTLTIKSLPAGLDGAYHLRATVTDPSSGTNATASTGTVNVVPATVVLSGAFVTTPASAKVGHAATLTISVTNSGTVAVTGPLSVSPTASAGAESVAVALATYTTGRVNIKPGATARLHIPITVSAALPSPFFPAATVSPGDPPAGATVTDAAFAGVRSITVVAV